jgi:hypothetical protein
LVRDGSGAKPISEIKRYVREEKHSNVREGSHCQIHVPQVQVLWILNCAQSQNYNDFALDRDRNKGVSS